MDFLKARGIIDPHEKGILRDLIVSGDERLQTALDKFEEGDSAELEALMASGHLNKVNSCSFIYIHTYVYIILNSNFFNGSSLVHPIFPRGSQIIC